MQGPGRDSGDWRDGLGTEGPGGDSGDSRNSLFCEQAESLESHEAHASLIGGRLGVYSLGGPEDVEAAHPRAEDVGDDDAAVGLLVVLQDGDEGAREAEA